MASMIPEGIPPEEFSKLQAMYRQSLPVRLGQLHQTLESLQTHFSQEHLTQFQFHIHKMAGSAGSFGYPEVSRLCKEWDKRLSHMLKEFPPPETSSFLNEAGDFLRKVHELFNL